MNLFVVAASANAGYTSVQQQSNQQQHPSDMEKPLVSCKQNGHVESEHTPQMNGVESNCTTANNIGAESTERGRGRRNRGKQKEAQQQQQQHHHITQINKDNHSNSSTARNPSPLAQQTEHCETCSRLEVELKKMRSEVSHLKQIENELRQKCDQNSTAKSCLQAKQKENEELEKKYAVNANETIEIAPMMYSIYSISPQVTRAHEFPAVRSSNNAANGSKID